MQSKKSAIKIYVDLVRVHILLFKKSFPLVPATKDEKIKTSELGRVYVTKSVSCYG